MRMHHRCRWCRHRTHIFGFNRIVRIVQRCNGDTRWGLCYELRDIRVKICSAICFTGIAYGLKFLLYERKQNYTYYSRMAKENEIHATASPFFNWSITVSYITENFQARLNKLELCSHIFLSSRKLHTPIFLVISSFRARKPRILENEITNQNFLLRLFLFYKSFTIQVKHQHFHKLLYETTYFYHESSTFHRQNKENDSKELVCIGLIKANKNVKG